MSLYDFTFLLNDKEELKNLKDLVQSQGQLLEEESWGNKRLAYPIKKQTTADFYNWKVEFKETQLEELKKELHFNEKLLRYLILKVDQKSQAKSQKGREKAQK